MHSTTITAIAALAATMMGTAIAAETTHTQPGVTITFLANEGVLLSGGGKRVLIDALFLRYGPEYAVPADSTQGALQAARAPFNDVDLLLVTHRHGDHFHPAPVAAHMRANARATLLTSQQVIDSLRHHVSAAERATPRYASRTTPPGTVRREVVNGIPLQLLGLPHTGGSRHRGVEHLGYIVELGGRRVLHVGDAEFTEATIAGFRLDTTRIDVALIPEWLVSSREGQQVIRRWIRPRQVVAFHLSEGARATLDRTVQAALPGAIMFSRPLEHRRW